MTLFELGLRHKDTKTLRGTKFLFVQLRVLESSWQAYGFDCCA